MAIDSRNKRASMICLGLPFGRVMPNPDGSLSTPEDRAQMNRLYAFESSPPPPTFNPAWASYANRPLSGTQ